jgi:hypothetical protein
MPQAIGKGVSRQSVGFFVDRGSRSRGFLRVLLGVWEGPKAHLVPVCCPRASVLPPLDPPRLLAL